MCCNFMKTHPKFTLISGCLLLLSGIVMFSITSPMIKAIVKSKLILKPGAVTYDFWKSVPVPIYYTIYMFNVTNPDDVLIKGASPHLEEVGPFVYKVQQDKVDIVFNSNGTVSYKQKKTYHYLPEKSTNISLNTNITHINIVLVAAISVIKTNFSYEDQPFMYSTMETGCNRTINPNVDCSLFQKHTVAELLFDGYDDVLLDNSRGVFPIPYQKFGFFVDRNATAGADGVFNTYTGETDINKLGYLAKWNNSDHLGFYEKNSKCDKFDYSSAGDFRPPYLLKESSWNLEDNQ